MRKTLTAVIICVIIAICFVGCNGIKESKNPESTALSVSIEADAASDDTDEHINNDITADCKQPANAEQAEIHSKEDREKIQQTSEKSVTTSLSPVKEQFQTAESNKNELQSTDAQTTEAPKETEPAPTYISAYEVEQKVAEYINAYRKAQGGSPATVLPGLADVARYRAAELQTDFSHNSKADVCTVLKYGEYIDMTLFGGNAEDSYYRGYSKEAIGKGDLFGTADQVSQRIAAGFKNSKGHWSYVGDSQYKYIAVGIKLDEQQNKWYCCICVSTENYGG